MGEKGEGGGQKSQKMGRVIYVWPHMMNLLQMNLMIFFQAPK